MSPDLAAKLGHSLTLAAAAAIVATTWFHPPHGINFVRGASLVALTPQGRPAATLNLGLVGSQEAVLRALHAAEWTAADPATLRSSISAGASAVDARTISDVPARTLMFEERRQDLAFGKSDGPTGARRQLRLWKMTRPSPDGRPLWVGTAVLEPADRGGPGQAELERDRLISELEASGALAGLQGADFDPRAKIAILKD